MRRRFRPRTWRSSRRRDPSLGNRLVFGAAIAAAVAAVIGAWLYWGPGPAARAGASTDVVLAPGQGLVGIAATLQRTGVIRARILFIAAAELGGAAPRLKAGEYAFPSRSSLATVISKLRSGAVVRHFVTIPEGLTSRAAMRLVDDAPYLTGAAPIPPEGSLLPETYEAQRGESRRDVIDRMRAARTALLEQLWRDRAPGLPYETPQQGVTLASIVEKETAKAEERPRIAAVFINRLRRGLRLESDPTIIYGLNGGAPLGHGLRRSELASGTRYNTYRFWGLPPTPICNPGRAALIAAFHPALGDDLYFVADGTGGHAFSSTYEDHRRNVARWRAIEETRLHAAIAAQYPGGTGVP